MSEQEVISPQSKRLHVTTLDVFSESWLILIIDSFSLSILVGLFCHISLSLMISTVLLFGNNSGFVFGFQRPLFVMLTFSTTVNCTEAKLTSISLLLPSFFLPNS